MRHALIVLTLALCVPASLAAQERPKFEIGTRGGLTHVSNGDGIVVLAIPGSGASPFGSLFGNSTLHLGVFASRNVMLEPQLNVSLISDGSTFTNLILGFQASYLTDGVSGPSPYFGPSFAFLAIDTDQIDSETDLSLGAALGYRFLPFEFLSVRIEGFYRRWFDFEVNEFGVSGVFAAVVN